MNAPNSSVLFAALGCALSQRMVPIRPGAGILEAGETRVPFASSGTEQFVDEDGRPCGAASRGAKGSSSWEAREPDDFACTVDTRIQGVRPAALELQWRAVIPVDGNYQVVSLGHGVGVWGRVQARGAWFNHTWARAEFVIEAHSPHCGGTYPQYLARAGSVHRGIIDVTWFGFDVQSKEESNDIFALRPRAERPNLKT